MIESDPSSRIMKKLAQCTIETGFKRTLRGRGDVDGTEDMPSNGWRYRCPQHMNYHKWCTQHEKFGYEMEYVRGSATCMLKKYLLVRPMRHNSARIFNVFCFGVVLVDFPRLCHGVTFGLNLIRIVTRVGLLRMWT